MDSYLARLIAVGTLSCCLFIYFLRNSPTAVVSEPPVHPLLSNKIFIGPINARSNLVKLFKELKSNKKVSIVDVGGSANSWTAEFADMYLDFNPISNDKKFMRVSLLA